MAPNGHAPSGHRSTREHQNHSPQNWLDTYGHGEYQTWKNENPTQHLSYDDWKISKHVNGLSLYYATLHILEESDSSEDEEAEVVAVKPRSRVVRGPSAREPKKKVTNGHGRSRVTGSTTPSALAVSEDMNATGKRKRKTRKKYLSEEIVASDGDSDLREMGTSTTNTGTVTPSTSAQPAGGRRKSSGRKPRKKPLSEEIISPEDEIDDPMAIDEVLTPVAVASPLPVRSAPRAAPPQQSAHTPKKTILKLSTKKIPNKRVLSEATVVDDDTDDREILSRTRSPSVTVTADTRADPDSAHATLSPEPGNTPSSTTRRGLRTRRPAQQRPYFHDAQLFDVVDPEEKDIIQQSPNAHSRRVSITPSSKSNDGELNETLDEEAIALLHEDLEPESSERRPKHFKGKGRAWKKEESDEDEEFTLARKKAAKAARAKAKGQIVIQKKRGRPRKSVLSEDIVHEESETDADKVENPSTPGSPLSVTSQTAQYKGKAKPRKSGLSGQTIRADSDADVGDVEDKNITHSLGLEATTPVPRKRGRPRKSDQTSVPKPAVSQNGSSNTQSTTLIQSPNRAYALQGMPDSPTPVSLVPKGEEDKVKQQENNEQETKEPQTAALDEVKNLEAIEGKGLTRQDQKVEEPIAQKNEAREGTAEHFPLYQGHVPKSDVQDPVMSASYVRETNVQDHCVDSASPREVDLQQTIIREAGVQDPSVQEAVSQKDENVSKDTGLESSDKPIGSNPAKENASETVDE